MQITQARARAEKTGNAFERRPNPCRWYAKCRKARRPYWGSHERRGQSCHVRPLLSLIPVLVCSARVLGFPLPSGTRAEEDPVIVGMLASGIDSPPSLDDDDRAPRAAG